MIARVVPGCGDDTVDGLEPVGSAVGDHGIAAQEADEGEPGGLGQFDGQRRGGRYRREQWDPGHDGFLGEFETGASRYEEHGAVEREAAVQYGPADDLVDGVVAADVLADHQHRAGLAVEERGGVQPAGAVERGLRRAQDIGETRQSLRGQAQRIVVDAEVRLGGHRVDAGLAAHPARAGRGEIALDSGARGCDVIGEEDIDHIAGVRSVRAGAVAGRADVGGVMDHAFGDEEPGGELDVVAGGAHRDGQRSAVDADLQRFVGGDEVGTLGGEVPDPHARHTSSNGDVGHVLQYRPCRAVSVGRGGCAPARGRQGCHGAPGRTRTCGLPIRSRLLYPTELRRLTARGPWRVYPAEVMVPALTRLRA